MNFIDVKTCIPNGKSLDEFDIEHCQVKVKVTVGLQNFSPFTTIQSVRSHNATLAQARKLILSMYDHLILIYKIYLQIFMNISFMNLRIPKEC